MLNRGNLHEILSICLKHGADFSEIYFEDTKKYVLEVIDNEVTKSFHTENYGVGIRIFKGLEEVYGYTNDLSKENLLKMADSLGSSFMGDNLGINFVLHNKEYEKINDRIKNLDDFGKDKLIKMCLDINHIIKAYDSLIWQAKTTFSDENKQIIIANSKGEYIENKQTNLILSSIAVAKKDEERQTGSDSFGRSQGYEMFDDFDYQMFAEEIAKTAKLMINAEEMVGQNISVIIHNGFGGVILHEACAHMLEATSVAQNLSLFSNKINQMIASPLITAIDDGTIKNAWGSMNIDDEGNPSKKNILIDKGILKSYMIDDLNSRKMQMPPTSSSRRESYKYSPTSRMTNTYIDNGTSTFEEIIQNTKYAFFAKKMGGGSVNPISGEFNFAVLEGYMVKDGKITKPIRGATLVGNGAEILKDVDMVGNNLSFAQGMCGSKSGSIPTNVGQPTIRITKMTVGGKGSESLMDFQVIIDYAKKVGFTDFEIHINQSKGMHLDLFLNEITKNQISNLTKVTLKGIYEHQMSIISLENLDHDNLLNAVDILKNDILDIKSKEEANIYPGDKEYPKMPKIIMNAEEFSIKDKIEIIKTLEKNILNYSDLIAKEVKCFYVEEGHHEQIYNSLGLNVSQENHLIIIYAIAKAFHNNDSQSGFSMQIETDFTKLDPHKLGVEIAKEAISKLNATKISTKEYECVLSNKAFISLLSAASSIFNGERAMKKLSPLLDKLNQKIMSEQITIIDEGINESAKVYEIFDSEGVSSKMKKIVENGVFKTFLHNLGSAKTLKANLTGNATKLGVSPMAFYIENGKFQFNDLLKDLQSGYLITELIGIHSGFNPLTCDFSLQSKGFLIENGIIGKPITLSVVSGNFLDMMNKIQMVGDDLIFINQFGSPSINVGKLMVSGE